MSIELRRLLENAKGTNEHIIAIVLDIRGFTPFCKEEESLNVANFIKRVYIRIIDDYFPKASFYKPTGDGLLIIITYTPESLKDIMTNTVKTCLSLVQDFGELCKGDSMIYFDTPERIGIGLSRGTACCISSGGTIIDYSGRVINLASRLNDFARPFGIVFDQGFGLPLLPKEMQELFLGENVYVRGIAEDKPMTIYFTKKHTIIPASRKMPLKESEWVEWTSDVKAFKQLKEDITSGVKIMGIELERRPLDEKQITIQYIYDLDSNRFFFWGIDSKGVQLKTTGKKYFVGIANSMIAELCDKIGVKDDSKQKIIISYPAAPRNA